MKKIYGSAIVLAQFLGAASVFAAENSPQTLKIVCPYSPDGKTTTYYEDSTPMTLRALTNAYDPSIPYSNSFKWSHYGVRFNSHDDMWEWAGTPVAQLPPNHIQMDPFGVITCTYSYKGKRQSFFTADINQDYTKNYDFSVGKWYITACGDTSNPPCSLTGTLKK